MGKPKDIEEANARKALALDRILRTLGANKEPVGFQGAMHHRMMRLSCETAEWLDAQIQRLNRGDKRNAADVDQ
jgi:hypothetical protein